MLTGSVSKEIKFLLTHSSIYGLGSIISRIVAFILLPLYTRYLTPQDYGLLELIDISTDIIGLVVTLGIVRSMSRYYYEKTDINYRKSVISTTYSIYIAIAIFCSIFLYSSTDLISKICLKSEDYGYYFAISFTSMLLGGLIDIGLMYFRLIKKSHIFISITLTRLCFLIILIVLFIVYFQMGVLGILYSTLISRILYSVLVTSAVVYKNGLRFNRKLAKALIKFSLPLVPANLLNLLVNKSDRYFILYFISIGDTGIYSLAQKIGSVIHSFLTQPFLMAYAPRRFEINSKDPKNTPQILSKIYSYYTLVMISLGLCISIFASEIVKIMTTPKFYRAGALVPIIILTMIIYGFRYHFEYGILWAKKTKYFAYVNFFSSILNISLNLAIIPIYGIWGALFTSFVSIIVHSVLLLYLSNKLYHIPFEFAKITKMFLLAFLFYYVSTLIRTNSIIFDILFKTCLIISYSGSLAFLKILTTEEKLRIISLFNLNKWKNTSAKLSIDN